MNQNLTLDDIYFKDAFTQTGNKLNLEVDNAEVESISSKNNAFSLDCNGNLVVNTITTNSGNALDSSAVCNIIYPVGSIYMSVNSTNPATLFGGTWTQLKDRFLLGAGDTYTNGSTGGSKNHNHSLSNNGYAEISLHTAGEIKYNEVTVNDGLQTWNANFHVVAGYGDAISQNSSWGARLAGHTDTENTLPPYLTVYIWKRIA